MVDRGVWSLVRGVVFERRDGLGRERVPLDLQLPSCGWLVDCCQWVEVECCGWLVVASELRLSVVDDSCCCRIVGWLVRWLLSVS